MKLQVFFKMGRRSSSSSSGGSRSGSPVDAIQIKAERSSISPIRESKKSSRSRSNSPKRGRKSPAAVRSRSKSPGDKEGPSTAVVKIAEDPRQPKNPRQRSAIS